MVIDHPPNSQPELFGLSSGIPLLEAPLPLQRPSALAKAKPDQPKRAEEVSGKVAREFAAADLFSELLAVEHVKVKARDNPNRAKKKCTDPDSGDDKSLEPSEVRYWQLTDELIVELHQACLEENLKVLLSLDRDVWVDREKGWTLRWIFTVDQIGDKDVRTIPFSFHNCCLASGCLPDELRRLLLNVPLVRTLLTSMRLYRESELPAVKKVVRYSQIAAALGASTSAGDDLLGDDDDDDYGKTQLSRLTDGEDDVDDDVNLDFAAGNDLGFDREFSTDLGT